MLNQIKAFRTIRGLCLLLVCGSVLSTPHSQLLAQETRPVGKTKADQQRNALLLSGYDYSKYIVGITGYNGQDRQRIGYLNRQSAVRTRIGSRGMYKVCMSQLPDGKLVAVTSRRQPGYYKDSSKTYFTMYAYESADLGLTWQKIGKHPLLGKDGKGSLRGKESSLTTLPDGSLVMTAHHSDWTPGSDRINHIYRSSDGGRTWDIADLPGSDYPRNLILEPDGSLLMVRSFGWGKGNSKMQLGRSGDGGKTWEFSEGIVDWKYTLSAATSSAKRIIAGISSTFSDCMTNWSRT